MASKIRHGLFISIIMIGLFFLSNITSHAQTVHYFYDDLNRLWQVIYDTGTVIQYNYDEVGNRTAEIVQLDATAPTGTIDINSGEVLTGSANVTLTLSCTDSFNCFQMQFSNSNQSGSYSTPEDYGTSKEWVLTSGDGSKTVYVKFKDMAGNWSNPYIYNIFLDTTCSNPPVKIGSVSYPSL